MKTSVYLDYHATTPIDPRVLDAMMPYLKDKFGNAASKQHAFGWVADEAVEIARGQVAVLMGAKAREIIFTSGATEANNLALFGVAQSYAAKGKHVITVATEHKSVLDPCGLLKKNGYEVTTLKVDRRGHIDLKALEEAIVKETILLTVMAANNEIGTLHPMAAIGKLAKKHQVLFHTDAAQAVGKIPMDVEAMNIDLLSLTAHKIYGPKGVGALYIRSREPHVQVTAQMLGGGHERGLRSGTLPVPLIVGFGKACALAAEEMAGEAKRLAELRDRLQAGIVGQLPGVTQNGDTDERLPHNLNLSFAGVKAEAVMIKMDTIAVSTGSACTTGSPKPSHVLRAIHLSEDLSHASIRFGLGRFTTAEEIDYAIEQTVDAVTQLRAK